MSIYQLAKDDLATIITASVGISITTAHFTILAITENTNTEVLRNTKAYISFTEAAPVRGESVVYYDRLNVDGLRKLRNPNIPPLSRIEIGGSVYNLFNTIRNEFGVNFTAADIEETFSETTPEGKVNILIQAKSDSLGWVGVDTLTFEGPAQLTSAFSSTILPGF